MTTHAEPSITAEALIDGLLDNGVIDEPGLVQLLGEKRTTVTLNELEFALVDRHGTTLERLLEIKSAVSGVNVLFPADNPGVLADKLSDRFTSATGCLVLDKPDLTVAMIEDTFENRSAIAEQLGTWAYAIRFVAAPQWEALWKQSHRSGKSVDELTLPDDIHDVLDRAVQRNASDVHLGVGEPPVLRVDGTLERLNTTELTLEWLQENLRALVDMAGERSAQARWDRLVEDNDLDFAITYGTARFRVNLGGDRLGLTAALRKIPSRLPKASELNLPEDLVDYIADLERGLVLITGPTGSGKTTTNAAILQAITQRHSKHVVTLEDPIEYFLAGEGKALVHQRELGASFDTFSSGLRQALRQDPDVILVGELRDRETMETALHAAETGHLVFGTLHTVDAPSSVARIVTAFPGEEQEHVRAQLAYVLKAVVAQTLLPRRAGSGRIAAFEIMKASPAVSMALRKADGQTQLRQAIEGSVRDGMQTLDMHLSDLVKDGHVLEEIARLKTPNIEEFQRRLDM